MGKFKLNIGDGLLSDVSKAGKQAEDFKIVPLALNLLDPNKDNDGISVEDIDELAQSILENGLDQNFVVVPSADGRYKILTGHRRRLACIWLVEHGYTEWEYVPCLIKNIDKIKLNLSPETKELYALLTTNIQRRNETLADKLKMLEQANIIFDELQANGEDVGQRRKWIAEHLQISDSQVKIMNYIQTHAEPEIKDEISDDRISPSVANEIAHLTPDEQHEIHEERKQDFPTMSAEDVKDWKKEREIKRTQETAEQTNKHVLTAELLETPKKRIEQQLPFLEHGLTVSDTEYQKLLKMQESLNKTLEKMSNLLLKAEYRKQAESTT